MQPIRLRSDEFSWSPICCERTFSHYWTNGWAADRRAQFPVKFESSPYIDADSSYRKSRNCKRLTKMIINLCREYEALQQRIHTFHSPSVYGWWRTVDMPSIWRQCCHRHRSLFRKFGTSHRTFGTLARLLGARTSVQTSIPHWSQLESWLCEKRSAIVSSVFARQETLSYDVRISACDGKICLASGSPRHWHVPNYLNTTNKTKYRPLHTSRCVVREEAVN